MKADGGTVLHRGEKTMQKGKWLVIKYKKPKGFRIEREGEDKTRKEQWTGTMKLRKLKEKLKDIDGEMRRDTIMKSISSSSCILKIQSLSILS